MFLAKNRMDTHAQQLSKRNKKSYPEILVDGKLAEECLTENACARAQTDGQPENIMLKFTSVALVKAK